jgi:glycosyltransferase involved in cell wall biosynthesis
MAQEGYPPEPRLQRAYQRIEQHVFTNAARVIATTAGTAQLYRERFPAFPAANIVVIPNGFDDELFAAPGGAAPAARPAPRKLSLLHSGVLYPSERDPLEFFAAVAELRDAGVLRPDDIEFRLRATGHDGLYAPRLEQLRLQDLVRLLPPVPYKEALAEMSAVDACMVFQGSNCNQQVPAKVYEYLYAGRPVLGLAEPEGDTGRLLADFGIRHVTSLHDRAAIKRLLPGFLEELRADTIEPVERSRILRFSRRETARSLGELLDGVLAQSQRAAS